tara:strand:- start:3157 stop:3384 length:228 start_codon:yes stop_codon:yes gene_type:complete
MFKEKSDTMKCYKCKSVNLEVFYPKDRKRKKMNHIVYCQDCKAMKYVFILGKDSAKIREYMQIDDYIKRGDNIYR